MPFKDPAKALECRRKYRAAHREQVREGQRKWNTEHRDQVNENARRRRKENPEAHRQYQKKYRDSHKDAVASQAKEYRQTEQFRETIGKWRKANAEKLREFHNKNRAKPHRRIAGLISDAKARARKRGLPFDGLRHLIDDPATHCACCGASLDYSVLKGVGMGNAPRSPSLDRIDNARGYTADNVAVICYRCNAQKGAATIDDLMTIVAYMRAHQTPAP